MKSETELDVFIGPHILFSSFEVGKELVESFSNLYSKQNLWAKETNGRNYISLLELIKLDLNTFKNLKYTLYCDENDTFISTNHYSYRADHKTHHRNLTLSFLSKPIVKKSQF